MKKALAAFLAAAITAVSFAGCGTTTTASSAAASQPAVSSQAAESTPASGTWKTGLAVITSIGSSTDVKDGKGLAEADSTVVAVAVDQDGKIAKCLIDAVQTKVQFSDAGKILTPLDTVVKSKQELGAEYGLGKASGIKKEWNEQADAFASYVVGKTADEVKGIAVNSEGKATDKELTASVTIHVGDFIAAVEKAVANATDNGAKADDKLGLGIETSISGSKDAGTEDGLAQAYSYYTVTTTGADGKITSCIIDASQTNVNFSKAGKITSDLKAEQKTKNELGDAYGMKKASKIGKEWNEEAAAFAKYVVGKTLDEVKGIAVDSEGKATDKELTASVTVHVGDFIKVIDKAVSGAK
jgi:hypothetical protein